MTGAPIKLPQTLAEFVSGVSRPDVIRVEQLANALQDLRVQVTVNGTTQTAVGYLQISGDSAIIVVNL